VIGSGCVIVIFSVIDCVNGTSIESVIASHRVCALGSVIVNECAIDVVVVIGIEIVNVCYHHCPNHHGQQISVQWPDH